MVLWLVLVEVLGGGIHWDEHNINVHNNQDVASWYRTYIVIYLTDSMSTPSK